MATKAIIPNGPVEFRSLAAMNAYIERAFAVVKPEPLETGRICECGSPVGARKWFCKKCLKQRARERGRQRRAMKVNKKAAV